jgi:hypothetical protein
VARKQASSPCALPLPLPPRRCAAAAATAPALSYLSPCVCARLLQILIERATRNKRKCITTVIGLDLFGIKLADASKKFGKKFACGASVTKDAANKEQIDVQARRR